MRGIRARFIERIKRTASVESFRFILPERINFAPGQFSQLIFDRADRENKDLNKYLSFSSSPTKEYVEFTKRLSPSQFSQKLRNLKEGDEVLLKAPLGACIFRQEYTRIAFLIGGIGITPVISIIEYVMDKKLDTDVCLAYSNRTDDQIAFKKELDLWGSLNKKIKVNYVVTDCQPRDKSCIFGKIDHDLLKKHIYDLSQRMVFVFGPPQMVEVMHNLSLESGCPKENIKIESFIGY